MSDAHTGIPVLVCWETIAVFHMVVRGFALSACVICVVNMLTRPFTFQERGMSRGRKPVKPVC